VSKPAIIELDLPLAYRQMFRRLLGAPADNDPRDVEIATLRASVDQLADELAALQLALAPLKPDIVEAAEVDTQWEALAKAAWPDEVSE
jgi:hypothetical protein